jgi:hypothetical protein
MGVAAGVNIAGDDEQFLLDGLSDKSAGGTRSAGASE